MIHTVHTDHPQHQQSKDHDTSAAQLPVNGGVTFFFRRLILMIFKSMSVTGRSLMH